MSEGAPGPPAQGYGAMKAVLLVVAIVEAAAIIAAIVYRCCR